MKKKRKHVTMRELPKSARPMEKLHQKGGEALEDSELLALLLGTGSKGASALSVAKKILKHYPLKTLTSLSAQELSKIPGVGSMKAVRVLASFELGSRVFKDKGLSKTLIESTEDAIYEFRELSTQSKEQIVVLYLNSRHELLAKEVVAVGKVNSSLIEPREVIAPALSLPCSLIIIAHNHPSDNSLPSEEDIEFTKRVQQACTVMGIDLVDHIIVCEKDYFSFRESSLSKASRSSRSVLTKD